MPTYSYACKNCGQAFDVHQSFTDEALTVCPNCGGELRKKFGNVGVVFKGGGFYRTDSQAGGSGASKTPSTSESAASSGASSTSSSESSSKGASSSKDSSSSTASSTAGTSSS